ncbi:MAG: AAA family ATPase [Deltaproteobacteria bacterium]|nr:AAA family ATPase [Deltaproteobacteria bacterium]
MEHLQHFGLSQDPFSNESDLRLYFDSPSHRDAQRRVERGLRQHKGLTLLTGEGGMGKTLLARRMLDGLEEEIFEATLLVMLPGAADAMGIFQRFARQLGADEPARDRAGVLSQIFERLAIVREDGRHAVLIVDDAQVMSPQVFAELGGLLSLEYEDRRLMSMLFVGSPELDRQIRGDASLFPRVDVRVRIQPLDLRSATAYLMHRLSVARGRPELIPAATMEALYKFGRGRPRLLNTLADNALFEAYLAGRHAIDPGDVERAAADLGILGGDPEVHTAHASSPAGRSSHPASGAGMPLGSSRFEAPAAPMRSEPRATRAPEPFDLLDELGPADESGVRGFDVDALDEIDLDLLAPEPVRAKPAPAPAPAPAAAASAAGGLVPELDGLFVELIEE